MEVEPLGADKKMRQTQHADTENLSKLQKSIDKTLIRGLRRVFRLATQTFSLFSILNKKHCTSRCQDAKINGTE